MRSGDNVEIWAGWGDSHNDPVVGFTLKLWRPKVCRCPTREARHVRMWYPVHDPYGTVHR